MGYFKRRRVRNFGFMLVALAAVWLWMRALERGLAASSFTSGYLLIAAVLFLALYNVRKKLPFLPLGSSAAWLQWHIYVGLGSVGLFVLHSGIRWPTGVLNSTLAAFYLATTASGLIGLYLTRTIPAQLARVGIEVIYERIPALQHQVRRQAGQLVLESVAASGWTTLADFYTARLYEYFHRPRGSRYFFRPTTALRRSLMHDLQDFRRYLSDHEQAACERLFALVRRKDDLDFHEARQKLLKTWLFVHIGLTYGLVILALLHGLLALAFRGGAA
jgi:hypothetical protein